MTDETTLLPCPFCPDGGKPEAWPSRREVRCQRCGTGFEGGTLEEAVRRWNRRYQPICKWNVNLSIDEGGCTFDTECGNAVTWDDGSGILPPRCMYCGAKVISDSND